MSGAAFTGLPRMTEKHLAREGATIAFDLHGDPTAPWWARPLLVIGSPMGASGFTDLVELLVARGDRLVVTYDPRGVERSMRSDGAGELTPRDHAADLGALVEEVLAATRSADGEPADGSDGHHAVDVFASSGGAVNALALVQQRPDLVATLVAHEPPLLALLPDREAASAAVEHIVATYAREGAGAGMVRFILLVGHTGELTPAFSAQEFPPPAAFGMPAEDDGSRDDALLAQNLRTCTAFVPDLEALRAVGTRIVPAAGVGSTGQLAHRAAEALASELGVAAAPFPGDHGGFMGPQMGAAGPPTAFADRLLEVLAG